MNLAHTLTERGKSNKTTKLRSPEIIAVVKKKII